MGSKSRRTPAPATPASVFVVSGTVEQLNAMVPVLASYFFFGIVSTRSVVASGQHARNRRNCAIVSQSEIAESQIRAQTEGR